MQKLRNINKLAWNSFKSFPFLRSLCKKHVLLLLLFCKIKKKTFYVVWGVLKKKRWEEATMTLLISIPFLLRYISSIFFVIFLYCIVYCYTVYFVLCIIYCVYLYCYLRHTTLYVCIVFDSQYKLIECFQVKFKYFV